MKILFVTSTPLEYSSSANMRNIALINGFIELGYEVSTLSSDIEKNSKYIDKTLVDIKFKNRYWISNSTIHENMTKKSNEENSLKSSIKTKLIKFIYKIYSKLTIYDSRKSLVNKLANIRIDEEFDLIISSSDPKSSHLIAKKLLEINPKIAKKWIQYWGDPFCIDINKRSCLPKSFIKKEEEKLIKACDCVVYVSPFTLDKQQQIYKKYTEKMKFLPIPYKKEIIYPKTNNKYTILGYFGDYNSKDRNIVPLYNTVEKMDIGLEICGNSDFVLESTEKIRILPRQKMDIIREKEKNVDLLVCVCNKSGTQIPGKVYHYAATNKPILLILDGENRKELKEYFERFNRYIICENTEESIEQIIKEKISIKENYCPSDEFKSTTIANKFIELL